MAANIGHLAVLISAQTAPLQKDMNTAAKIAGDGAKKMKDEVDRKGTLWGDFFRGAFLLSQFKKLVNVVRMGVKSLSDSGDAASVAAQKGLAEYDAAMNRIAATLAKALAPALGFAARGLANTAKAFEDLIDVYQFDVFGDGLDKEMRRRDQADRDFQRMIKQRKAEAEAIKKFNQDVEKFRPSVDALRDPFQVARDRVLEIEKALADGVLTSRELADNLIRVANDDALKTLGLVFDPSPIDKYFQKLRDLDTAFERLMITAEEWYDLTDKATAQFLDSANLSIKSDFDTYLEKVEQLNQLRANGWIEEAEFLQMYGAQVEKLAATQEKLAESKSPEALIRGTAAAFSAINAFQRGKPDSKRDAIDVITRAAKEQAERDAEQIRLGKEANRHLAKFANIEAMGP